MSCFYGWCMQVCSGWLCVIREEHDIWSAGNDSWRAEHRTKECAEQASQGRGERLLLQGQPLSTMPRAWSIARPSFGWIRRAHRPTDNICAQVQQHQWPGNMSQGWDLGLSPTWPGLLFHQCWWLSSGTVHPNPFKFCFFSDDKKQNPTRSLLFPTFHLPSSLAHNFSLFYLISQEFFTQNSNKWLPLFLSLSRIKSGLLVIFFSLSLSLPCYFF